VSCQIQHHVFNCDQGFLADPFVHLLHILCRFELRKNIPVTMQLTNTTGDRVAFKVKTTSPKKYCVRPSSGIIEPNAVKEVQVILQSQREPPVSYADCRDKFLVQCIKIDASVKEVTSELFADPTKAKEMKQTKLRVVMIPPAKPPSPVPEGNESEPTSPPFKGGALRKYSSDIVVIVDICVYLLLINLEV